VFVNGVLWVLTVHKRFTRWAHAEDGSGCSIISRAPPTKGVGWQEHHRCLAAEWLPALDGVVTKLEQGGSVADVGCGHGASTILVAQAR
jgi:hypothetical protein